MRHQPTRPRTVRAFLPTPQQFIPHGPLGAFQKRHIVGLEARAEIEAMVTVATTPLVEKTSDPCIRIWEDWERMGGPCTRMSKSESECLTALTASGPEACS